jgi:hypothetical protein
MLNPGLETASTAQIIHPFAHSHALICAARYVRLQSTCTGATCPVTGPKAWRYPGIGIIPGLTLAEPETALFGLAVLFNEPASVANDVDPHPRGLAALPRERHVGRSMCVEQQVDIRFERRFRHPVLFIRI